MQKNEEHSLPDRTWAILNAKLRKLEQIDTSSIHVSFANTIRNYLVNPPARREQCPPLMGLPCYNFKRLDFVHIAKWCPISFKNQRILSCSKARRLRDEMIDDKLRAKFSPCFPSSQCSTYSKSARQLQLIRHLQTTGK